MLFEATLAPADDESSWSIRVAEAAEHVLNPVAGIGLHFASHDEAMALIDCRTFGIGRAAGRNSHIQSFIMAESRERIGNVYYQKVAGRMMSTGFRRLGIDPGEMLGPFGAAELGVTMAYPSPRKVVIFFFELEKEHALSRHEQRMLNTLSLFLELGARTREIGSLKGVLSTTGQLLEEASQAHKIWDGLCSGRYSLAPRARGTARHFVIVENASNNWMPRQLRPDEKQILELAAAGMTGKRQAWTRGIATTTASRQLSSAAMKLGFSSTLDAIRLGLTRL